MKRDSSHKSTKRQKENPQTRFTTRLTSTQIHLTTHQAIHQIHNTQTRPAWKQIPFASQQEDTNRSTKEIHNKANLETDSSHKPPEDQQRSTKNPNTPKNKADLEKLLITSHQQTHKNRKEQKPQHLRTPG